MATYGFLDVLQEELDKNFPFDYEISWDKRNHAVEVSFLLEAQNAAGVELVAFGLGNFLLTKKSGRLHLSRTAK